MPCPYINVNNNNNMAIMAAAMGEEGNGIGWGDAGRTRACRGQASLPTPCPYNNVNNNNNDNSLKKGRAEGAAKAPETIILTSSQAGFPVEDLAKITGYTADRSSDVLKRFSKDPPE
jgi:hypothetical protein